jgi:hypothetical protein
MKTKYSHASYFIAVLAVFTTTCIANTFSLNTTFDNSVNNPSSAGIVVGNGFFDYTASSVLADGSYTLSSFVNPTFNFVFSNGASFSYADLVSNSANANIGIDILGSQFNFTTTGANSIDGSSALFQNVSGNVLSFSPNAPGQSYGLGFGHAAYYLNLSGVGGRGNTYFGAYGIGANATTISDPSTVPEPSTYALFGLGALALVIIGSKKKV